MLFILSLLTINLYAGKAEQKGLKIAKIVDKTNTGFKGESSEMTMVLINAYGDRIERRMVSKLKEIRADGDKSIVKFLWPADVKGTKLLTWGHKKGNDDQWLYLPSLRKVKRISSRSKSGAFMGSEFSYEDLGSQEIEKFKHKFLRDAKYKKKQCWVTQRVPVDAKSGYSKQISWIDKSMKQPLKINYYDKKGVLLKVAKFTRYRKIKGFWRAGKLIMSNKQTKKKSILTWKKRRLKKSFSNYNFSPNRLSK